MILSGSEFFFFAINVFCGFIIIGLFMYIGWKIEKGEIMPYFCLGTFISIFLLVIISKEYDYIGEKYNLEKKSIIYSIPSPYSNFTIGVFHNSNKDDDYISYMVRSKSDNEYKYILLRDISIIEDESLKNTGSYIEFFDCSKNNKQYRLFFFWLYHVDEKIEKCDISKKILSIPVGAVQDFL